MQSLMTPGHKPVPVEILEAEIRKVCGSFDLEPMRRGGVVNGDVAAPPHAKQEGCQRQRHHGPVAPA